MRSLLLLGLLPAALFGQGMEGAYGTWKINLARSTFAGGSSFRSLTVRIERHPKGEVFTLDRIETDGRTTSSSTILYLDGEPRRFEDFGCSGIQSSWRAGERTVEIVRMCANGGWVRLLRRASSKSYELVLEIIEQSADGRRFDCRLILERQQGER
jgi:hypothetical protein